ncbi:MAG: putative divalent heavy-metal cations transporter [Thermoleophilia bacterium]|nr:putative divalent heavy-metal cations transporter [Thermoleophilia bacterium]
MTDDPGLLLVFLAALGTALATGLGALPLLFLRDASPRVLGTSTAAAGGLMLAATQLLLVEGVDISWQRTAWGVAGGIGAIWVIARFIHAGDGDEAADFGKLRGANARTAFLIIAVMTAHSAAEGIGVGVSFGGGEDLGILVALAIAIHNIPEGLAISLALVPHGSSVRSAAGWSIFSSLPQPLLAIPAFLFVEAFRGVLPVGLGVAGGAMLWMVVFELLPEATGRARWPFVASGLVVGYLVMLGFTILLGGA